MVVMVVLVICGETIQPNTFTLSYARQHIQTILTYIAYKISISNLTWRKHDITNSLEEIEGTPSSHVPVHTPDHKHYSHKGDNYTMHDQSTQYSSPDGSAN